MSTINVNGITYTSTEAYAEVKRLQERAAEILKAIAASKPTFTTFPPEEYTVQCDWCKRAWKEPTLSDSDQGEWEHRKKFHPETF